jgi:hypothetical protein
MNDEWTQGRAGIGYTGGDFWEWQKGRSVYLNEQAQNSKPAEPAAPFFTPSAPQPVSWVPPAKPASTSYSPSDSFRPAATSYSQAQTASTSPQYSSGGYYEPGFFERIAGWFSDLLTSALEIVLLPFRWAWKLIKIAFGLLLCLLVLGGLVKAFSHSTATAPSPIEPSPLNGQDQTTTHSSSLPHVAPKGQRYIQLASEPDEVNANARAAMEAKKQNVAAEVCVFESPTGFGIALGPLPKEQATEALTLLKYQGTIPGDSILAAAHHQMKTCYPTAMRTH